MEERIEAFHSSVLAVSGPLKILRSTLHGKVSSHTLGETVPLSTLPTFERAAAQNKVSSSAFIGSIGASIVVSASAISRQPLGAPRKRKADTAEEEAERAIEKVKRTGEAVEQITPETFDFAKAIVVAILRLRGAMGEAIVESWAVSLRKKGDWGAPTAEGAPPSLVVGCRLSAGVPVHLSDLTAALGSVKDGLLTTSMANVNDAFVLPLSEQAAAAEVSGQKSILLLATVPFVAASN